MKTCVRCGKEEPDERKLTTDPCGNSLHRHRCINNRAPKCIFHDTCGGRVGFHGARNMTCDKCHEDWCRMYMEAYRKKTEHGQRIQNEEDAEEKKTRLGSQEQKEKRFLDFPIKRRISRFVRKNKAKMD